MSLIIVPNSRGRCEDFSALNSERHMLSTVRELAVSILGVVSPTRGKAA